ncbi:MAG: hypothetical protein QM762_08670 [Chryseolinea sp.]
MRFEQALTARGQSASYIETMSESSIEDAMKPNDNHETQALSHLTAVHLLGRMLERIDQHQHVAGSNRYDAAMRCLNRSLDEIEQQLALRDMLDRMSASAPDHMHGQSGKSFCKVG